MPLPGSGVIACINDAWGNKLPPFVATLIYETVWGEWILLMQRKHTFSKLCKYSFILNTNKDVR